MSILLKNLPRWLVASIYKHVRENASGYNLYLEGEDRQTTDLSDYFELRIDGPDITECSRNEYKAMVHINLLVSTKRDEIDAYKIHKIVGVGCEIMARVLNIYRYGDTEDDNSEIVGCLIRHPLDAYTQIAVDHYGQVDPNAPVLQASVAALYLGDFDGSI